MRNRSIKEAFREGTRIDRAMDRAFLAAVRLHRMHGVPMAVWEEGRVVLVDPHEISLPEEEIASGGAETPLDSKPSRQRRRAR